MDWLTWPSNQGHFQTKRFVQTMWLCKHNILNNTKRTNTKRELPQVQKSKGILVDPQRKPVDQPDKNPPKTGCISLSSHLDLLQLWGYNGHSLEEISWIIFQSGWIFWWGLDASNRCLSYNKQFKEIAPIELILVVRRKGFHFKVHRVFIALIGKVIYFDHDLANS